MTRPVGLPAGEDFRGDKERQAFDRLSGFFSERAVGRNLSEMAGSRRLLKYFPQWADFANSMLRTPELYFHYNMQSLLVRKVGDHADSYSHYDREWVQQVVMWELDYYASQIIHLGDALHQGVRPDAILALAQHNDQALTADELLLATFARQVIAGKVANKTWNEIEDRIGPRGAVELSFFITYAMQSFRLIQAVAGNIGPTFDEVVHEVQGYIDGSCTMPTDCAAHPIEEPEKLGDRPVDKVVLSGGTPRHPEYG